MEKLDIYLRLARRQINHNFGEDEGSIKEALGLMNSCQPIQGVDMVGALTANIRPGRADTLLSKLGLDGAVGNCRYQGFAATW